MRTPALAADLILAAAPAAACPPGLTRKDPPCVPPGLARQGAGEQARGRDDGDRRDDTPARAARHDDLLRDHGNLMSDVALVVPGDGTALRPGDRLPPRYRALALADDACLPPLPPGRRHLRVGDRVAEVIAATETLVRPRKLLTD